MTEVTLENGTKMPLPPPDPVADRAADETKLFDALQMQLRGYELARLNRDGEWEVVGTYRPNNGALREAIVSSRALEWRSRKRGVPETYAVRPVVSVSVDFLNQRAAPQVDVPAEALVTPDLLRLDSDQDREPEEPSLVIKPDGTEFAGTGFPATPEQGAIGNVEIPYNYDQLASSIDIPNPWGDDGK